MPEDDARRAATALSASVDELLTAALDRGDTGLETGRFIVTFREGAVDAGIQALTATGMQVADAREFTGQAVGQAGVSGAGGLVFPEIGAALLSGAAAQEQGMSVASSTAADSPFATVEPEYFAFTEQVTAEFARSAAAAGTDPASEYLRGFVQAADVIARDLYGGRQRQVATDGQEALVLGATWGLGACRVPQSAQSGVGVTVAVLDTGVDPGHPDLTNRNIEGETFVGQPVQDLHSHGTHCIGTACGPQAPPGTIPRYGIAYRSAIFAGKVLSNSGSGSTGGILNGINWAIANRCQVISMSLGSQSPVQAAYTAAGRAALDAGLLIVAAAGNSAQPTGSPANSPTIMSVASVDPDLAPSAFSNFGKIDISGPGRPPTA